VHELGLCEAIMVAVERRAAGRKVLGVRVRIGARHQVVQAAFDQAFTMVAMGTVAEDAAVEWIIVPVQVTCGACGHQGETTDVWATCAHCGSPDLDITGGDDLMLESIEVSRPSPKRVSNGRGSRATEGTTDGN
jgi:hydrogenase nickel incorporation protein HypA/HybF